eukprot:464121_1
METGDIVGWCWWSLMVLISILNFILLLYACKNYPDAPTQVQTKGEYKIFKLSAIIFTIICAYRAVMPRIDVTRVCWFDTPANWILFGRITACIAEICWALQMGLLLRRFALVMYLPKYGKHFERAGISVIIIACIAECNSWANLITENNFFAVIEQFLWMVLFEITGIGMILLLKSLSYKTSTLTSYWIFGAIMIIIGLEQAYEAFGLYLVRYLQDENNHKIYYGFSDGLKKLTQCNQVTQNIADWDGDAPWMTGYFSIGVWSSIWLFIAPFNLIGIADRGLDPMLN